MIREDEGVLLDMTAALHDVCETILLYGRYPNPRYTIKGYIQPRIQFDLREWVTEHIDPSEMADLYISMLTDYSHEHDDKRIKEAERVERMLKEELRDSTIVRERAEQLAEEL